MRAHFVQKGSRMKCHHACSPHIIELYKLSRFELVWFGVLGIKLSQRQGMISLRVWKTVSFFWGVFEQHQLIEYVAAHIWLRTRRTSVCWFCSTACSKMKMLVNLWSDLCVQGPRSSTTGWHGFAAKAASGEESTHAATSIVTPVRSSGVLFCSAFKLRFAVNLQQF